MGTECGSRLGLQSYKELPLAELGKSNRDGKEDSWVSDRDGGLTHSKKKHRLLMKLASGKRRLTKCYMMKTTAKDNRFCSCWFTAGGVHESHGYARDRMWRSERLKKDSGIWDKQRR